MKKGKKLKKRMNVWLRLMQFIDKQKHMWLSCGTWENWFQAQYVG